MTNEKANDCNPEQENALKVLIEGSENVFLTGNAGTGKSYVIKQYLEYAKRNQIKVACLAPTGIAAIPLQGITVHRFFKIGAPVNYEQACKNIKNKQLVVKQNLLTADVIVIDEISMLHGWIFAACDDGTRKILNSDLPWGGKRIIVVGDFLQLSPVPSNRHKAADWQWCFYSKSWNSSMFKTLVLNNIVRQDEKDFLEALNEARSGDPKSNLENILKERSVDLSMPEDTIHLFPRNEDANKHNSERLQQLKTSPVYEFKTKYDFKDDINDEITEDDIPLPEILKLKTGARIIFRQNNIIDPSLWANGTLGFVEEFKKDLKGNTLILIKKDDGKIVEVDVATFEIKNHENKILATADNYPLNLAWGITVHKSQGSTLDRAYIDLKSVFAAGQAYVGLSRVKSKSGLFVNSIDMSVFVADPDAVQFNNDLINNEISFVKYIARETKELLPGNNYSAHEMMAIFDINNPNDFYQLIVRRNDRVILIKGRRDYNPKIDECELRVAENDKNSFRSSQVASIIRSNYSIPLFVKLPVQIAGKEWQLIGFYKFQNVILDKENFPKDIKNPDEIQAIIRLGKEDI